MDARLYPQGSGGEWSPDVVDRVFVDPQGNDSHVGGSSAPVKTLTKALSLVTTVRKTICMAVGTYAEAATLAWPSINGLKIIGGDRGGNTVITAPGTNVLTINPTFTTTTFEAYLQDLVLEHTAQVGLEIDNQHMTRKLLVHLIGMGTSQVSSGDSIHVTHTTAGQAIRIYAEDCDEIEGLTHLIAANADDRFRFTKGCVLIGGLTVAGAVAAEVTLLNSVVLTGAYTTDGANVLTNVGCCYRTDAGVYTQLVDAFSA